MEVMAILALLAIIVAVLTPSIPAIWKWLHRPLFIPAHGPDWKPEHLSIWQDRGIKTEQICLAVGDGQAAMLEGKGYKRLYVGFLSMREVRAKTLQGEAYLLVKP